MPIAAAIRRRSVTGEHQSLACPWINRPASVAVRAGRPAGAAALPRDGRMCVNDDAWTQPWIAAQYAGDDGLQPPEAAALALVEDAVRGQPILDLGVGLGRTTGPLRALGGAYVGIDVSAEMVAACRARHPAADIRRLDAP